MSIIFDLPSAWRDRLMPASFRNARFHCEVSSKESGRRIVMHEFPKKDFPYAEDMGRMARTFSLRGYCIVYPYDSEITLYSRDYRLARDELITALEKEGPGTLQLPTLGVQYAVCSRYRVSEEERFGGYCVFDMTFMEQGIDPQRWAPAIDTGGALLKESQNLRDQVKRVLQPPSTAVQI